MIGFAGGHGGRDALAEREHGVHMALKGDPDAGRSSLRISGGLTEKGTL